jgi:hypothetical protein
MLLGVGVGPLQQNYVSRNAKDTKVTLRYAMQWPALWSNRRALPLIYLSIARLWLACVVAGSVSSTWDEYQSGAESSNLIRPDVKHFASLFVDL